MTGGLSDGRHLTFSNLDRLWSAGSPLVLPIRGEPPCDLRLDPTQLQITLVTDYESPEPDLARLSNVTFGAVMHGTRELAEITVRVDDNVHGAYGLLSAIADALQLDHAPLASAVSTALARHKRMFATRIELTIEKEVGLFGELLLMEYLIHAIGSGPAVAAWQGPLAEEHDFVLEDLHLEVKTTVSERRLHTINGLTQLVPLHGVPLSVISIQVTRAAPRAGRTLPSLVHDVRHAAGGHNVAVDQRLELLGWHPEDADLYRTSWVLRTLPRAYAVTGEFPAMTPERVGPVVPNFGLVSDVSYRVDLTDLDPATIEDPIAGFVEPKGP